MVILSIQQIFMAHLWEAQLAGQSFLVWEFGALKATWDPLQSRELYHGAQSKSPPSFLQDLTLRLRLTFCFSTDDMWQLQQWRDVWLKSPGIPGRLSFTIFPPPGTKSSERMLGSLCLMGSHPIFSNRNLGGINLLTTQHHLQAPPGAPSRRALA